MGDLVVGVVVCRRYLHRINVVAQSLACCECPEFGGVGVVFESKHFFPVLDAGLLILLRGRHCGTIDGIAMPPKVMRLLKNIEAISERGHERVLSPALSSDMQTESAAAYMPQL